MALVISDYQNYLAGIVTLPAPKPVVSYSEDEVMHFIPTKSEMKFTTEPIVIPVAEAQPIDTDKILSEWDQEIEDDVISDVVADAIEGAMEKLVPVQPKPTLLETVKADLVSTNPWEINFLQFASQPAGDRAMVIVFEDAVRQAEKFPQAKSEVDLMVSQLVNACETALSNTKNEKGFRPADVYRSYARPLRFVIKSGFDAKSILRELLLAQTMPLDELDNPSWIDSYTGEVDPDADQIIRFNKKIEDDPDTLATAALEASEDFDTNDGQDDVFFDEWDIREPASFDFKADLQTTEDLPSVRFRLGYALKCVRGFVEEHMDEPESKAQRAFLNSKECRKFMGRLQAEADQGTAVQDLALIFLSIQHERAFPEEYANRIFVKELGEQKGWSTLGDWLAVNGDEFLEQFVHGGDGDLRHDYLAKWDQPLQEEIDLFCDKTLEMLVETGVKDSKNIVRTPQYLQGFFQAVFASEKTTKEQAQASGWDAWREWKSPEANKAYHNALHSGKDKKTAMKVFWFEVNKAERLVKEGTIVKISPNGLQLSSGRKIDWHIAQLKLKNQELNLDEPNKLRLKNILTGQGWGLPFAKAL